VASPLGVWFHKRQAPHQHRAPFKLSRAVRPSRRSSSVLIGPEFPDRERSRSLLTVSMRSWPDSYHCFYSGGPEVGCSLVPSALRGTSVSTHLRHRAADRPTTEPRANGCCDSDREESEVFQKRREVRSRWKTIGVA
jgi:hypothetical protein